MSFSQQAAIFPPTTDNSWPGFRKQLLQSKRDTVQSGPQHLDPVISEDRTWRSSSAITIGSSGKSIGGSLTSQTVDSTAAGGCDTTASLACERS